MNLHPLTEGDFYRILHEPEFGIVKQNIALLGIFRNSISSTH